MDIGLLARCLYGRDDGGLGERGIFCATCQPHFLVYVLSVIVFMSQCFHIQAYKRFTPTADNSIMDNVYPEVKLIHVQCGCVYWSVDVDRG